MLSDDFTKLWARLSREWKTGLEQSLAPLTEGQLHVLELLLEQTEPIKPSDLIRHLETTPAAITTLLDRMERNELIVRTRDNQDRRIVWISVSERGGRRSSAARRCAPE